MSEVPPRPPAPNTSQNPAPGQASANPEKNKPSKTKRPPAPGKDKKQKKGLVKQARPIVIMAALLAGVTFAYLAVRAGREALSPPDPKSITLPSDLGRMSFEIPDGWKEARMGDVDGSSGRWAFGTSGARDFALFLTRYPLKKTPQEEEEIKKMLAEAQQSMAQTGGPQSPRPATEEKIAGQKAYRYAFKRKGMWIDIWLVVHSHEKRSALYQFACQSRPGDPGEKMRERCVEILNSGRFSDKQA